MTAPRLATREENIRDALQGMWAAREIDEGMFSSLGMLITDSVILRDVDAVRAAHEGLRRMHDNHPHRNLYTGQWLGMISVTYWALRRLGGRA